MSKYDKKTMDKNIFDFIYGCALSDAILQKSFDGKRKWIKKVDEAQECVKKYIDSILNGDFKDEDEKTKEKHDEAFLKTAVAVCQAINSYNKRPKQTGEFHFGNAQKLINMTVKHVYAHTYSSAQNPNRECFRYCHCPMDGIMLSSVWKECKKLGKSLPKNFCDAWGRVDFNRTNDELSLSTRYLEYQKKIKEIIDEEYCGLFPIEYDYIFWQN